MGGLESILIESYRGQFYSDWPNSIDCKSFLQDAAKRLGIFLPSVDDKGGPLVADKVIDYMRHNWFTIGRGIKDKGMAEAFDLAKNNFFVVAGIKHDHLDHEESGHVAIVLPISSPYDLKLPMVYNGSRNESVRGSHGKVPINFAFPRMAHADVQFFTPFIIRVPSY
jgi:hypothetical protein